MKNLAELLSNLGGEAIKRYEAHTGLNGIGTVINPMVQEHAQRYVGGVKLDPNGLAPLIGLANIVSQHWDRLRNPPEVQQEQVRQSQAPMQPMAEKPKLFPGMKGAPVPGFIGRQGRR